MTTPSPTTKDDLKLTAALAIRSIAKSLQKSCAALDEAVAIISGPEASHTNSHKKKVATALRALKESISSSCNDLSTHVKVLDPIPGLQYVHSCQKTQQQRSPLGDITNKRANEVATPNPRAKKAKKTAAAIPFIPPIPVLSPPKNETQCSRAELITVLSKTCNNPKIRNAWISTVLDSKLVPVVKRQIHRLMQKHEQNGVPINQLDKP